MSYMHRRDSFAAAARSAALALEPAADRASHAHGTAPRGRARLGVWRRLRDRITAQRVRRDERQVAIYIQSRGGCLTDAMEREMTRRLTG